MLRQIPGPETQSRQPYSLPWRGLASDNRADSPWGPCRVTPRRPGTPPTFQPEQICQRIALARQPPSKRGRPVRPRGAHLGSLSGAPGMSRVAGESVRGLLPPDGFAAWRQPVLPRYAPLQERLRHELVATPPVGLRLSLREWLDGVADALCMSPAPTGDYAPWLRSPWHTAFELDLCWTSEGNPLVGPQRNGLGIATALQFPREATGCQFPSCLPKQASASSGQG